MDDELHRRGLIGEALCLARRWSKDDLASRDGAEYRFHENQNTCDEQRREDQISTYGCSKLREPVTVRSINEGGQEKNGHADAATSMGDLDQDWSYAWIQPHGVVRHNAEKGNQNGQHDRY